MPYSVEIQQHCGVDNLGLLILRRMKFFMAANFGWEGQSQRSLDCLAQDSFASLTGESIPSEKRPGSEVIAGSVNGTSSVVIKACLPAEMQPFTSF